MRIYISFYCLILFFLSPSVLKAQNTQIGQLENQFKATPTPALLKALCRTYQEQASWFQQMPQFNFDSVVFYFDKAIVLLENTKPLPYDQLAEAHLRKSQFYYSTALYVKATDEAMKADTSFEDIANQGKQNKLLHYEILFNWALVEVTTYNPKMGLELFFKAITLLQDETNPEIQALLLKNKGEFYSRYNNGIENRTYEYIQYAEKSLHLYQSFNNPKDNPALFNIYGIFTWKYNVTLQNDSCDYYYAKMAALLPQLNNPLSYCSYYSTRGNNLFRRKQYNEATEMIQKCLKIAETYQLKYSRYYTFGLDVMGAIRQKQGHYDEAIAYFEKSRDLNYEINGKGSYTAFDELMSELYEDKGDYVKALSYYKTYSDSTIKHIERNSSENIRKSELQLDVLNQEKELVEKSAERNLFLGITLIALLLLSLLAFIFLRERRSKAKLTEQNHVIEAQSQALRQLDAAKSRFFANVSHELRTPLTLMLAPLSTTLKSNTLDNRNFTLVSLAKQHARQLLGLVNEILDLTKLESGKMTVHEEPTNAYNLLRRLVATFESYAEQKHINLIFDFNADAPRGLMLDKAKVERIVNNLLSNALKFTPSNGSITVKVSHTPLAWQLAVTDTGRGIHPDDLPQVFNRFYQSNQLDMPVEGGTGIGLSLAKELAQAMGGSLSVESTLGNGATFTLNLPKREVLGLSQAELVETGEETVVFEENGLLEAPSVLNDKNGQKTDRPTILVVEDNPSLRSYLQLILSDKYNVLTAENGQEALNLMGNGQWIMDNGRQTTESNYPLSIVHYPLKPDLIVSDIMMPVMDGFQLLEKLKADDTLRSLPVVMLTARAEMQDRLKALRIGVDDYLTKPFEEEELFARIKNLLHNAKMRQQFKEEALIEIEGQRATDIPNPTSQIEYPLSINAQKEQNQLSTDNLEWLSDLEKTVRQHLGNYNLSVDFIADEMHISRAQFYRRLQLLTGLTPLQYLQEIRLNHARQLLEQRKVSSVKAAAAAIGIQKVQHFSEQFKERFGKLPSEYLA
jgi:signal transduction histidine kinase/DNA-binding response OmpR family regulator